MVNFSAPKWHLKPSIGRFRSSKCKEEVDMDQLALGLTIIGIGWLLSLFVFLRLPLIYRRILRILANPIGELTPESGIWPSLVGKTQSKIRARCIR